MCLASFSLSNPNEIEPEIAAQRAEITGSISESLIEAPKTQIDSPNTWFQPSGGGSTWFAPYSTDSSKVQRDSHPRLLNWGLKNLFRVLKQWYKAWNQWFECWNGLESPVRSLKQADLLPKKWFEGLGCNFECRNDLIECYIHDSSIESSAKQSEMVRNGLSKLRNGGKLKR